ncbi:MAG: hypothetical protein FGM15_11885 [Chthoniobacterales bacterium]|nr:hypothetical protein [Chthoniobacterales bacterium]
MIYEFSLRTVGLAVGLGLIVSHLWALAAQDYLTRWLRDFPRSKSAGIILSTLAAIWAFWLAATMDLGEFTPSRTLICGVVIAGAVMVPLFAEEFLAVRALGILALLATEPLLGSAFLRPEQSRLLLVVLAYVWAVAGLVFVAAPYVLRDMIAFITQRPLVYRLAALAGVSYGLLLVAASFLFFRP